MKQTFENTKTTVKNSISSIFSKDDVIAILNSLETQLQNEQPSLDIDKVRFYSKLESLIDNNIGNLDSENIVDFDSAELSLDYNNKVIICGMGINSSLSSYCLNGVEDLINKFFDKKEIETND